MEKFLFSGEVFHKLGGKFHKVPIYIRTAQTLVSRIGKHTVQAVPEFVQECFQFAKSQQSRFILSRLSEVHDDGYMWAAVFTCRFINPLLFVGSHPCA